MRIVPRITIPVRGGNIALPGFPPCRSIAKCATQRMFVDFGYAVLSQGIDNWNR